jgi:iron transport multicopper oxidase
MFTFTVLSLSFFRLAFAGYYQWDITWVAGASPDGFNRPIIGVNKQWPPPVLQAELGERVTVVICNKLGNQSTSLHWHGFRQFESHVS